MNKQLIQIARRIKELREILGITAEEVSKKCGVDVNEYILYEEAKKDISIGVLYAIADILGVDPTELLTGEAPKMGSYTIVRQGNGVSVERYKGYSFSSLAFNFKEREMQPMIVTIKRGKIPEPITHKGQEFNYVLEGEMNVHIDGQAHLLKAGDSIYFNSMIPHGQSAVSETARFLTVINE